MFQTRTRGSAALWRPPGGLDALHYSHRDEAVELTVPEVQIPPRYRGVTRGAKQVEVGAAHVRACLNEVEGLHPGFLDLVVDPDGELRRFVRLFLNGDELPRTGFDVVMDTGDVLAVVTGAAGG